MGSRASSAPGRLDDLGPLWLGDLGPDALHAKPQVHRLKTSDVGEDGDDEPLLCAWEVGSVIIHLTEEEMEAPWDGPKAPRSKRRNVDLNPAIWFCSWSW